MSDAAKFDDTPDFSLILGGPLYQLFLRLRMAKPPLDLLTRRMIIMPLIAWLPLLLMSAQGGQAIGGASRCRSCLTWVSMSASSWRSHS
jgi:hypothetical protein